jgi:hypothetical protein
MSIFGYWTSHTTTTALPTERHFVDDFAVGFTANVAKISVLGSTEGAAASQQLTGVVYSSAGVLLGSSEVVTVEPGKPLAWTDLRFSTIPLLTAGTYYFGVRGGATTNSYKVAVNGASGKYVSGSDATFNTSEPTGILNVYATVSAPWSIPEVEDLEIGRLPWEVTQSAFMGAVTDEVEVVAGWHGTKADPEIGAFALVDENGPLKELVGDVIRVSRGFTSIFLYVNGLAELPEEDLSLTRRAFLALGPLAATDLDVTVGIVG